jgi:hypothetical protein
MILNAFDAVHLKQISIAISVVIFIAAMVNLIFIYAVFDGLDI